MTKKAAWDRPHAAAKFAQAGDACSEPVSAGAMDLSPCRRSAVLPPIVVVRVVPVRASAVVLPATMSAVVPVRVHDHGTIDRHRAAVNGCRIDEIDGLAAGVVARAVTPPVQTVPVWHVQIHGPRVGDGMPNDDRHGGVQGRHRCT